MNEKRWSKKEKEAELEGKEAEEEGNRAEKERTGMGRREAKEVGR